MCEHARRFKPQAAYAGGTVMCTSASMHWLLACLYKDKRDFFPHAVLDTVMRWGAAQHTALSAAAVGAARMLQHEEVIRGIAVPAQFPHRAYCGLTHTSSSREGARRLKTPSTSLSWLAPKTQMTRRLHPLDL